MHGEDSSTIKESQPKKMRADLDRTAKGGAQTLEVQVRNLPFKNFLDGRLSPEKNMDNGQEGLLDPMNRNAMPSGDFLN